MIVRVGHPVASNRRLRGSRVPGPGSRRSSGFTLLEILLALTLLAFVMVGVWGALSGATRITHSADALMAQGEDVHTTQRFLRTWLADAQAQPYRLQATARARMFRGDADEMHFVAPLPMQSGHAGLYLQTLKLLQDRDGRYTLELAYVPYVRDRVIDAKPATHVLLANLRGGKFQYLATTAFGKRAAWRDDWTALHGLPLAVRIHLAPRWRVRVPFPDMVIPLHSGRGFDLQPVGGVP